MIFVSFSIFNFQIQELYVYRQNANFMLFLYLFQYLNTLVQGQAVTCPRYKQKYYMVCFG